MAASTSLKIAIFLSSLAIATCLFQCYQCNSLTNPECEHKYEKFGRVCPVKVFNGVKNEPIGCRVVRQYVHEEYSLDRQCAYLGETIEKKSNKGSMGVQRIYSQCSEPRCNSAETSKFAAVFAVSMIALKFFA